MFQDPNDDRLLPKKPKGYRPKPASRPGHHRGVHAVGGGDSLDLSVMRPKSLGWALDAAEFINDLLKGFGIVAGGILASMADWVLGTITVAVLFESAETILGFSSWVTGTIWSGAMWGVQLILWQLVLSGQIKQMFTGSKAQKWANAALIVVIILLKLGDDYIDMSSITWMLANNEYQGVMGVDAYNVLITALKFVTWFLVGFSEAFVAAAFVILRRGLPEKESRPRPARGL